jgi:hypothetical protein
VVQFRVVVSALAALAALPASAQAAMVSPSAGEVRVGNGEGYRLIVAPTEVAAGAQVMVSPNGAASIAYTDTCIVSAPAAAITIVKSRTPCSGFAAPSYFGFTQSNQEGVGVRQDSAFGFTPKVDADAPDKVEEPQQTQSPPKKVSSPSTPREPATAHEQREDHRGLLIVGGIVVGAGALAAVLLSQGDSPSSP